MTRPTHSLNQLRLRVNTKDSSNYSARVPHRGSHLPDATMKYL